MVAEPGTHAQLKATRGIGFTFAQGKEIWLGHPDRLRDGLHQYYPKTYRSLVKAMIEASVQQTENRAEVAKLITDRSFTGAKPKSRAPSR